jgi:hypothetical protein
MLAFWGHQDARFRPELWLSPLFYQGDKILIFPARLSEPHDARRGKKWWVLQEGKWRRTGNRHNSSIECPLRLQHIALVDPPASKEAVAHHLLAKQKNEADQDDQ